MLAVCFGIFRLHDIANESESKWDEEGEELAEFELVGIQCVK